MVESKAIQVLSDVVLSTPFWEFRIGVEMDMISVTVSPPFYSLLGVSVERMNFFDIIISFNLSTPFWEFPVLIPQSLSLAQYLQLSTPFWEFL